MTNTISLAHIYGLSNGLFLSAFVFMVFFGFSYLWVTNLRHIGKLFLFFSISFLGFFLFNLLFQHAQGTVASQSFPKWLLAVAKFSMPVALFVFAIAFVRLSIMRSPDAYAAYQGKRKVLYALNALNILILIALYFVQSVEDVILLSYVAVMPYLLLMLWYFHIVLKSLAGRILMVMIVLVLLHLLHMSYLIFTDNYQSISTFILPLTIFLSLFIMMASFTSIRFTYFDALKYHQISELDERNLLNDMRQAVKNHELFMVYQPQVSPKTGQVLGLEALIRWQHPVHGLVPPNEFIPLAEATGLIDELCKWTIDNVLTQQQYWLGQGKFLPISLNLSVANLNQGIADFIISKLAEYNVPAELLCLEITESLFLDFTPETEAMLKKLRTHNLTLSIDDYGTGFSSLNYLKKLSLSELKIDRSFIHDIDTNQHNLVIVQSIFFMCQGLGMKIVAEGVETEAIANILNNMHCDCIQGYGIAKPMTITDLEAWLSTHHIAPEEEIRDYSGVDHAVVT